MKKTVMKKWIKALRSGKYKQGQGTLKQYNRKGEAQHCCLGVLCELYNQEMKKSKKKTLPEKTYNNDYNFSHGYSVFGNKKEDLPKEVMKWSGIKDNIGTYTCDSPEYGQYNRKGEAQHCCLGVLCDLYNREMKKNKKKTLLEEVYDNDSEFSYGYTRFGNKRDDLPKEVMKWSGINSNIGRFTDAKFHSDTLADLNDIGRKFKTISNIIEKNWENL